MSIIQTNQPNFFGNNGVPLANGYIYIGVANQSPIDNPQTVTFTNQDGTSFTASQPLRTNSEGKIQWNGKAIKATVDANYSILIQDSTQTDINGGYIAEVDIAGTSGEINLNDYREYGLILSDVKLLTPNSGETIGSVGKATVSDGLGADWLVVSNTGNPADDVDLIDFANGLQGVRLKNFAKQAVTSADKEAVRDNIDVYSKAETDSGFQAAGPAVVNYTPSNSHYIRDTRSAGLTVTTAIPISTTTTIGPTGSGASVIWTALDELPSDCSFVDLLVDYEVSAGTAQNALEYIITFSGDIKSQQRISTTTALFLIEGKDKSMARLSAGNIMTVNWSGSASASTRFIDISIIGFGV